ncbi:MAG: hypothetical protein VX181_19905, partial [Pseudomonadota bacterium]|nr:hypothetical protein [Pseudomonadota bacterium]
SCFFFFFSFILFFLFFPFSFFFFIIIFFSLVFSAAFSYLNSSSSSHVSSSPYISFSSSASSSPPPKPPRGEGGVGGPFSCCVPVAAAVAPSLFLFVRGGHRPTSSAFAGVLHALHRLRGGCVAQGRLRHGFDRLRGGGGLRRLMLCSGVAVALLSPAPPDVRLTRLPTKTIYRAIFRCSRTLPKSTRG